MRWLLLLPLVLTLSCKARDDRSTLDKVLERGTLILGTEPEFAPFETRNEKGEFVGFDMDLARMLAGDLGVDLRIQAMKWTSLPTALKNGEIDLIISGMTATPERAESLSFTDPYFHTSLCLLVHTDSGIEKPEDADGKRLVVKQGTTGDKAAGKLFPNATVTRLQKEADCALDVVNGRADAFLYDQLSVLRHHKNNPQSTRALLKPLSKEPYAMAVRLGDEKFVARLNRFLGDIRADGRYGKLWDEYFSELPDDAR